MYALTTKRTTALYVALFKYIERNICSLSPVSFMTDYETALRNGLKMVYPGVPTRGCWFHHKQAVRRYASKWSGFDAELRCDADKYRLYAKFGSLPLLPGPRIHEGFRGLKEQVDALNCPNFTKFVEYYEKQWLKKVCCF